MTVDLVRTLIREGFEVRWAVLRPRASTGLEELERSVGVPIMPGPSPWPAERFLPPQIDRARRRRWYRALLRRFDPELIYCATLDEELMRLNTGTGRPCVEHVHAIHQDGFSRGHGFLVRLATFADLYLCTSQETADRLTWCAGVPPDRVRVAYNGIHVAEAQGVARRSRSDLRRRIGAAPEEVLVGAVGRIDYAKGPDLFLRAAARSIEVARSRLRFVWIGGTDEPDNPTWRGVDRLAERLGIRDRVSFVDYTRPLEPLLAALDVVVIPSRAESLPLVMLEAMALGRPVAAFPVGGVPEVLERGGGVVTAGFSPDELGDAVASMADDGEARARLGMQGQRLVESEFDAADRMSAIVQLLRERLETGTFER